MLLRKLMKQRREVYDSLSKTMDLILDLKSYKNCSSKNATIRSDLTQKLINIRSDFHTYRILPLI